MSLMAGTTHFGILFSLSALEANFSPFLGVLYVEAEAAFVGVEVEKDLKLCSLLGVPRCGNSFDGVDFAER
jgi:hypothetical protein